ncbi:MAG: hypothetical protein ACD_79C01302G0001 [uncultured bacterium]|nr:MAG: hypothetical protein ACD_79C01302G0001 [uncultured bacterium]
MKKCRLCNSIKVRKLIDFGKHPIAHDYLKSKNQKEYVHSFILSFCNECGLFQISDPIPADLLYADYLCLSSWKHQPHIPDIIETIESLPGLDKTASICEVGSNDGRFLFELKKKGYAKLAGIEPAKDAFKSSMSKGIETISGYFNLNSAKKYLKKYGKCDIFISRQMLEHVGELNEFSNAMSLILKPDGYVVIEIPDFTSFLDSPDYTLWEEHINYFTFDVLLDYLSRSNIEVIAKKSILFSSLSLLVIGKMKNTKIPIKIPEYISTLREKATIYKEQWKIFKKSINEYLKEKKKQKRKIAIYGAGARLCSLVNFCKIGKYIDFIVDDQVEKQNLYMPGSRLPILPSNMLEKEGIDICLLAVNTECEEQVIAKHSFFLKRGGEFYSILPPSNRLLPVWDSFK